MRGILFALAFAAAPSFAELSANSLVGNEYIRFNDNYVPHLITALPDYKVSTNGSPMEITRGSEYRLRVVRAQTKTTIDEIEKNKFGPDTTFDIRTAIVGANDRIESFTTCSGNRRVIGPFEGRTTEGCHTITPSLCDKLSKAGGPQLLEGLREKASKCAAVAIDVKSAYQEILTPDVRAAEEANIKHLTEVSKGFVPDEYAKTNLFGLLEFAGSKHFKKTTAQEKNFQPVMDYFMHVGELTRHCKNLNAFMLTRAFQKLEKAPDTNR